MNTKSAIERATSVAEIIFDFCTGCGADYFVFPTRLAFTDLQKQGCPNCGGKEYVSYSASEGCFWRWGKWPTKWPDPTLSPMNENESTSTIANQLELAREDLECVHMWLDDRLAPRVDVDNDDRVLSIVGRMKALLGKMAKVR